MMAGTRLVFGWEPVARLLEEPNLKEMLRAHWEELSAHKEEMPLDTDFQRLVDYNEAGIYRVWAARDAGTLVGYIAFYVFAPPHHRRAVIAVDDGYYLDPAHRRGWSGVRMWRAALDSLAQLGVIGVIGHHKLHFRAGRGGIGAIFRRLGFAPTDTLWWLTLRGRNGGPI
jgi:GNAT superfamily N-acetyltransferase